jgi:hypothetical protein
MNIQQLRRLLESHDIPLDKWGKGKAKTPESLLQEIDSGESLLTSFDGRLYRSLGESFVQISFFEGAYTHLVLHKGHQTFENGRNSNFELLPFSIGKKIRPNESSLETAYRAFKEELGIDEKLDLREREGYVLGPVPSISYPGILTTYNVSVWYGMMPKHLFKSVYIETAPERTSYFFWTPNYIWRNWFPAQA